MRRLLFIAATLSMPLTVCAQPPAPPGLEIGYQPPPVAPPRPVVPPRETVPRGREIAPPRTAALADMVGIALSSSPDLREAHSQMIAAQGRAYQAGLYPNPQLGTSSPQLAGSQSQYNVFVSQDIITHGKLDLDRSALTRAANQAELTYVRTWFDVLTNVRQRFYATLAAEERVKVLENLRAIAGKSREVSGHLFGAEQIARTDLLVVGIEFDRAQVALENAQVLLDAARRQLATAVGQPLMVVPPLAGDLTRPLPDFELMALQRGVVTRNALARSAEVEIARSQILLERAIVEPYPNFNFMGGYQYQLSGAMAPNSQGIYQVTMSVPLWNRNQGNIRAAQANIGAARAQFGRVQNDLASQTVAALSRYRVARQSVATYERSILPKARESQRLTQQAFGAGQVDVLRLLQLQRVLSETQLEYINAQEQRWQSAAELAGLLNSEQFP